MSQPRFLPFDAPLAAYEAEAVALLDALRTGDPDAEERFKWEHPRFRDRPLSAVRGAPMDMPDARTVVARDHAFDTWDDLVAYVGAVGGDGAVRRFEATVDAVLSGDVTALRRSLEDDRGLVRARSTRRHHATLLHYVAANGVEGARQRTPPNAVEVATLLLDSGSEVDALGDMYDQKCTPLSMLVSSSHPAEAGVRVALVELLLDRGAAFVGPGTAWRSALLTALVFGFPDTAEALARRGAPVDDLPSAAGLGRLDRARRLLGHAASADRHQALSLAAQLGHADLVRLLLDAGEDPDRYNLDGFHAHATPLHQAVAAGHLDVVRLLVDRGAALHIRDTIFEATPLGWADYLGHQEIAAWLRSHGAAGN